MANSTTALRRQIGSASDLKSVVRTMRASAASAIGQYESSVAALGEYARSVEQGLSVCLRSVDPDGWHAPAPNQKVDAEQGNVLVFGSDQGLVGRFNEAVVEHAISELGSLSGRMQLWAIGARVQARLLDARLSVAGTFEVPASVERVTDLVGQILHKIHTTEQDRQGSMPGEKLILIHHRPDGASYKPVSQRLLPLDSTWQRGLAVQPWPTAQRPEVLGSNRQALYAFVREHLFVSLFRASAESLASENASRLAAMQRADRNIDELLTQLHARYHRIRQSGIDEELFDVVAGFDAMGSPDFPRA